MSDHPVVSVSDSATGSQIRYVKAGADCTPDMPGPGADGKHPAGTTGLHIAKAGCAVVGTSKTGVFYYGECADGLRVDEMVADFLRYEHAQGRVPILFGLEGVGGEARVAEALRRVSAGNVVRAADPPYLVHSTSREAGEQIRRDGAILSFALLGELGRAVRWHKLRSDVLGEPAEFADYVNLGCTGTPWVEVVPASHLAGRFLGPDDVYEPGWRFYFDARKMIEAGLIDRWCGTMRVRRRLPLAGFCVGQIDVAAVDAAGTVAQWTPRQFSEMADQVFGRQPGQSGR